MAAEEGNEAEPKHLSQRPEKIGNEMVSNPIGFEYMETERDQVA